MTMENQPSISRRGLLKWAGAGSIALAAAGALSACSPAQSELASTQGDTGAETDSALQERYADLPVEESSAYAVIVGGGAGGRLAADQLAQENQQLHDELRQLREQMGTAVILITHDRGVVAEVADAVMVMYAGQAVEYAGVGELFAHPLHPYTEGLLKSVPVLGRKVDTLYSIPGTVPSPKDYPEGCRFAPRCAYCTPRCEKEAPPLYDLGGGRRVRCFRCEGGGIDG